MFNHKLLAGFQSNLCMSNFLNLSLFSIIHTSSYEKLVLGMKCTLFNNICNNYTVLSFVVTWCHMSAISFLEGKNNNVVGIIIH